jgi:hypothetical protein
MAVPKIRNCGRCGKPFLPTASQRVCPECVRNEDEIYRRVQTYIRENREASVDEIATECEVSVDMIMGFVRAGRLEIELAPGVSACLCRVCGQPIEQGTVCAKCRRVAEQLKGLQDARQSTQPKPGAKPTPPTGDRADRSDRSSGYSDYRKKGS